MNEKLKTLENAARWLAGQIETVLESAELSDEAHDAARNAHLTAIQLSRMIDDARNINRGL